MKFNYFQFLIGILVGAAIMFGIKIDRCGSNVIKPSPIIKVDTFFKDNTDTIFKPKIVYRDRWKIERQIDSVDRVRYITQLDSFFIDTSRMIPVNSYRGTIADRNARLDYDIETLGFLIKFRPVLTIQEVPPVDKHWVFSVGLSDKVNFKTGIGYRGWLAEMEFDRKFGFNQLYITKQFEF